MAKFKVPAGLRVSPEEMEKALQPPERVDSVRPAFDETKLLRILDDADALSAAHEQLTKRRETALQRVREIERNLSMFRQRGAALGNNNAATKENERQINKLETDLQRAQQEFQRLDDQWQTQRQRLHTTRELANRLEKYARDELAWRRPGEPETNVTT
ncbi:AAA family ATPase [Aquisalimonas lutea]|uniref:AAA family ATPase n=1 Tax=Aquisalimonas lutea TaxID=1327750 RepID=UPI0025B4CEB3|nr:AAA family ATPase [Aquisalimonas lutea]MDN3518316.1 AAA family ATPase [Aquisalimonas lutea]